MVFPFRRPYARRDHGEPAQDIMSIDLETAVAVARGFVEKVPLERYVAPERPSLVGKSRVELAAALGELGVPPAQHKMRVQQLWHWLYVRGVTSFDAMTSVSKGLRAELEKRFSLDRPEVVAEQISVDGTRNGCCGCRERTPTSSRTRWNASTFRKPGAAPCAFQPRSDAPSIARAAIPVPNGSYVI